MDGRLSLADFMSFGPLVVKICRSVPARKWPESTLGLVWGDCCQGCWERHLLDSAFGSITTPSHSGGSVAPWPGLWYRTHASTRQANSRTTVISELRPLQSKRSLHAESGRPLSAKCGRSPSARELVKWTRSCLPAASELGPPRKSGRVRMLSFEMPIEEIRNLLKRFSSFGRSVVRKVLRV